MTQQRVTIASLDERLRRIEDNLKWLTRSVILSGLTFVTAIVIAFATKSVG